MHQHELLISMHVHVTVVVFAVMVWHSFSWLFVILAVCWLTFIGFTPIFFFFFYF